MEDSKFFRTVWRFNAVTIALAGILAVISLIVFTGFIILELTHTTVKQQITKDPESIHQESYQLGKLQQIPGSESVLAPLYSEQQYPTGLSSSKRGRSTRNILFSNLHTKTSHWLLTENTSLIIDHTLINQPETSPSSKNVVAIFYKIVTTDNNTDGQLTQNDLITLAFSQPNGTNFTEVIFDVENIIGYDVVDTKIIAILYQKDHRNYTAYISTGDFSLTDNIELPALPKGINNEL